MKNKLMDVIYVIEEKNTWSEFEIRFSLRSIEKHLSDIGNVFIVGKLPEFLSNVIHIPSKDIFYPGIHSFGDTNKAVIAACVKKGLSKQFLFLSEYKLILNPMPVANNLPQDKAHMSNFDIMVWKGQHLRQKANRFLLNSLSNKKHTLTFDCKTPVIFHKMNFQDISNQFDYCSMLGYSMNNIFGEFLNPPNSTHACQQKVISRFYSLEYLRTFLNQPRLISFGHNGLNASLIWWLHENYPFPSRFEKNLIRNKTAYLFEWDRNGQGYKAGIWVFEKFFKNSHIAKVFKLNDTPSLRKKLNHRLTSLIKQL